MTYTYRYAVIGSGPGGLTASVALGTMGQHVCLIESGLIGGDCTNYGCVPSKALLDIARKDRVSTPRQALNQVRDKRQAVRDEEDEAMLEQHGVTLIRGTARCIDHHTLQIDTPNGLEKITARTIIIATGGRPRTIEIPGVASDDLLTNEDVFELDEEINDLVVIGGGPMGCEMSEAFANLGVEVTLLHKHDRFFPDHDDRFGETMRTHLRDSGVDILFSTRAVSAANQHLTIEDDTNNQRELPYDKILLAIGRRPNISTLQLDNAQVDHTPKGILTNTYSQTNQSNIYAIGDCVAGNPQFTHRSNHEARLLVQNLTLRRYGFPRHWRSNRKHPLPWTIYTDPEFAHVGMTYQQAMQTYDQNDLIVRTIPFSNNDRSTLTDTDDGYLQVIAKRFGLKIIGATIVGKHAGELLPQYTLAIRHRIGLLGLMKTIYAYPTRSEAIKQLIDEYIQELLDHPWREVWYRLKCIVCFRRW